MAENSSEAERLILAAQVRVQGECVTQAGALFYEDVSIELAEGNKYASRGGLKLEGALHDFSFNPSGLNCIDVGASSGGFTDCLLQAKAAHVTAVDVGYGQFAWVLRTDARVTLFERTNIAKADPVKLGAPFDLLVADLSFTSLARLAPTLSALVDNLNNVITLVKPQFELPREAVKDGVVRSFDLHVQSLKTVQAAYEKAGLISQKLGYSPLLGPKGNIEFWIWATKQGATATIDTEEIVHQAHEKLASTKDSSLRD